MNYQLYPIRKRDLDKPLYLLVKAVILTHSYDVMAAYFQEFDEEAALNLKQLFFDHVAQRCFLVFPSRHNQFRLFPSEVTRHHAIMAVYDKVTMSLSGFYTLDSQGVGEGQRLALNWHDWESADVPAPVFPNNSYELLQAVRQVMQMLEAHGLASCEWHERISSVCGLLENEGDKMHILHNGGLYDHKVLRQFLKEQGLEQPQVVEVLDELVSQLEQYAMYVVSIARMIDRRMDYIYREKDEKSNIHVYLKTKKPEAVQRVGVAQSPRLARPSQEVVPPPPPRPERPVPEASLTEEPRQEAPRQASQTTNNKTNDRTSKNWPIIRRVALYTISILAVVLIGSWLVYLYKGAAVFIGGGVMGIVTYQVMRLSGDYEHLHPDWFRRCLLFFAIIAVWGFVFLGRWMVNTVYDLTNGIIGAGYMFLIVTVLMAVLFFWALRGRRRAVNEKVARPYSFLMVLSIIVLLGQILGSIVGGRDIENKIWQQSLQSQVVL